MSKFRKVSRDEVKKMIKKADSDKNGKISIDGKFLNFFALIWHIIPLSYIDGAYILLT